MSLAILNENLPVVLNSFPGINLVYLFGSQVTGQTGPMSDYDLAILDVSPDNYLTQIQFQHAMVKLLQTERVDVILINRAPIDLAYNIIAAGKLLFQREAQHRVEFEAQVLGQYGDYLPVLRAFKEQTLHGDENAKRVQRYREALGRTRRTPGPA
jgi:predicted nucleotidyltransferase